MQKNFVVEVYDLNEKRTYIVREADDASKAWKPVLVTESASDVAEFLSTCKTK